MRPTPLRFPHALAALVALLVIACSDGADHARDDASVPGPTVLLVTWDTTRADHVGAYGHGGGWTPELDALAAAGRVFERAWTTTPITLPSHTSLLTGTTPLAHGVRDNAIFRLTDDARLLSEVLADVGWRTGAFVGSFVLDERFGLDQGFETYTGPAADARPGARIAERGADAVVDDALAWLGTVEAREPVLLWVHFYDPHHPYEAPARFTERFDDVYGAEIAFCDEQLGRLLDGLASAGRAGRRLVVVTSDHGDAFGEHGEPTHGVFVYDSTMRVPLVLAGDDVPEGRVAEPVSVVDVAPTVLAWAGLPTAALPDATGRSLLADIPADDDRILYVESLLPHHSYGWHGVRGVVADGWKYIDTRRPELYDLVADPGELDDRVAAEPERARTLAGRLTRLLSEQPALDTVEAGGVSEEERAALLSLGYVSSHMESDPFANDLPDPKDRVHTLLQFDRARQLITRGRRLLGLDPGSTAPADLDESTRRARAAESFAEAHGLLTALREVMPPVACDRQLGLLELSRSDPAAAIPHFERVAADDDAEPATTHYNLGSAYAGVGDVERARAEMEFVVSTDGQFSPAYDWLARHHEARGEFGRGAFWRVEQLRVFDGAEGSRVWLQREVQRLSERAAQAFSRIEGPRRLPPGRQPALTHPARSLLDFRRPASARPLHGPFSTTLPAALDTRPARRGEPADRVRRSG